MTIRINNHENGPDGRHLSRPVYLRITGLLVILLTAGLYVYIFHDRLNIITTIESDQLALLLGVSVLMVIATGWTNALLLKILDVRLSFLEFSTLSFLTSFANYFGPFRAGSAVRASYLRLVKHLPISAFAGVMVANSVILLFVSSGAGLVMLIFEWYSSRTLSLPLLAARVLILGFSAFLKVVKFPSVSREGRIWNMLRLALSGLEKIRKHRTGLIEVIASILLQYVVAALVVKYAYGAMGIEVSILVSALIGVFNAMSGYLSITPNNIGLQEAVIGYLGAVSGLGLADSLVAAALIRAAQVLVIFVLSPPSWYLLLRPAGITMMGRPREN
ncbi:MAG: YbhN family protein [bacterium]